MVRFHRGSLFSLRSVGPSTFPTSLRARAAQGPTLRVGPFAVPSGPRLQPQALLNCVRAASFCQPGAVPPKRARRRTDAHCALPIAVGDSLRSPYLERGGAESKGCGRRRSLKTATKSVESAAALVICGLQKRRLSSIEAFASTLSVHRRSFEDRLRRVGCSRTLRIGARAAPSGPRLPPQALYHITRVKPREFPAPGAAVSGIMNLHPEGDFVC